MIQQQHPQQSSYVDPLSSSSSQFYHHQSQSTKNHQHLSTTNTKDSTILFPNHDQEEGDELERDHEEDWRDESHYSRNTYENYHMRVHHDNKIYDEENVQSKATRRTRF